MNHHVVQTVIQLQLLTGMRPDEVCAISPCDFSITADGVWEYQPESHKTQHQGTERRVFIGQEGARVAASVPGMPGPHPQCATNLEIWER